MNHGFELLDPGNAQAFLRTFRAEEKRKGNACFQNGCVQNLTPKEKGTWFSAEIEEGTGYEVNLEYDAVEGWAGVCTCEELNCHHQYAAMRALLAEHSTEVVRNLSASRSRGAAAKAAGSLSAEAEPGLNRR